MFNFLAGLLPALEKSLPTPKLCFVIGPIGKEGSEPRIHADWVLNRIIKPAIAKSATFEVKRADQDPRPGLIDVQLITDLLNADLVIADLGFHNPNVFYEIGIRHMAAMPIIHLQSIGEEVPFDVSLFRAIKFSRITFQDVEKAKQELEQQIEAVLKEDYVVENPVTRSRGLIQLREDATPQIR